MPWEPSVHRGPRVPIPPPAPLCRGAVELGGGPLNPSTLGLESWSETSPQPC